MVPRGLGHDTLAAFIGPLQRYLDRKAVRDTSSRSQEVSQGLLGRIRIFPTQYEIGPLDMLVDFNNCYTTSVSRSTLWKVNKDLIQINPRSSYCLL